MSAPKTNINYVFQDERRLTRALTHSSARHKNGRGPHAADYERLEFLGDRVLGLAIAEKLLELYPKASEGELARRLNRLVRKETCALVAVDMNLGPSLIMSPGEEKQGGRDKPTLLADACEAVLGAVFVDGGFEAARAVVLEFWDNYFDAEMGAGRDPKSALQEWAQSQGLEIPKYKVVNRNGPDHEPLFSCEVVVTGVAPELGEGTSKRLAQQAAASALLRREGVWASDAQ